MRATTACSRKPATIAPLVNTCWSLFKLAAILTLVVALGLGVYLFTRMDDEIRRYAEQVIAEKFPQFNVSIGGARLVEGRGIALYDLAISETSSLQLQNNLLVVDEIMLSCDATLSELAKNKLSVSQVVIKHPQVWISRCDDGHWNIESLWPLPPCGESRPQIVIKDAQIALHDQQQTHLPPVALREVNLTISPSTAPETLQASTQLQPENIPSHIPPLEIHGIWSGPSVKRVELRATVDLTKNLLHLETQFERFQIPPALHAWGAAYAPEIFGQSMLQGMVDGKASIQHAFRAGAVPRLDAQFHLTAGRLEDPRLPRPLTELECNLRLDNTGISVQELRGNLGPSQVAMQLQSQGWNMAAPLAMGLRIDNVPLDGHLYEALPALVKDQWDKYRPTGIADGELQLTFDGAQWRPRVTLHGRDLAFESDKFRYRLNNGSGSLRYQPGEADLPARIDIDLVGHSGGQPLKIVGQVFDPQPGARGWVEISGQNIEIQQRMIEAMPEKTRQVIESMHPTGRFQVNWRLERKEAGQLVPQTSLHLELTDCRIKYDKFPYPLSGIRGLILAEDKHWTFRNLASSGSRQVQCQGYLRPKDDGNELSLQFMGQQIPLDDDLKQALPDSVQKAWDEVRPRGQVDLAATVYHETGFAKPSIRAVINPHPDTATVQPKFFPYLLEQVAGTFEYEDGKVSLQEVRAQNGRTTVHSNGSGLFADDGAWNFELTGLSVDRLAVRRDLTLALPLRLRKLIESLKPTGSFRLHDGTLRFSKSRDALATIDSHWDVVLDCHQTDLQVGLDLRNVHGSVRLEGTNVAGRCYTKGELEIDSATFQDVQFTNIRGPLYADETSCRLGRWATEAQRLPTRRIAAKVYGGDVVGDGWITFDVLPEYGAQASLAGADLMRMMIERFHSQQPFAGKFAANINLRGRGRSLDNLVGEGDVKVTDANIYELPILVSLLKVLRNSTPDTTAFNQSNMRFRIQGRHIYLDQLDFLGDAVSLFGRGYTNFDQQLNLVFHGVVGRNDTRLPFVNNFLGQASQQIMQMYVDGTVADPQVHTQAFPGINNLIQQIQKDLDASGTLDTQREAKRRFPLLPSWGR
ncbi:MAG: hypothetical protein KDA57_13780 [Planctomycetales bacterium]|nr:hypothetical protein [Planctomycetales bacterium]